MWGQSGVYVRVTSHVIFSHNHHFNGFVQFCSAMPLGSSDHSQLIGAHDPGRQRSWDHQSVAWITSKRPHMSPRWREPHHLHRSSNCILERPRERRNCVTEAENASTFILRLCRAWLVCVPPLQLFMHKSNMETRWGPQVDSAWAYLANQHPRISSKRIVLIPQSFQGCQQCSRWRATLFTFGNLNKCFDLHVRHAKSTWNMSIV